VFTGIVTHRGRIASTRLTPGGARRFWIEPTPAFESVGLGDSVAVDGVCLTVAALEPGRLAFDVIPETLRKTTLGDRVDDDVVNLERALRQGDELGGHVVQGHVEGVGRIRAVETHGEDVRMVIEVDDSLHGGVLPKGSVALDGVSLTIGEVLPGADGDGGAFSVYLIPHTLAVTGLGSKRAGDRLNVEPDVLGRWVEHHVRRILGREVDPPA